MGLVNEVLVLHPIIQTGVILADQCFMSEVCVIAETRSQCLTCRHQIRLFFRHSFVIAQRLWHTQTQIRTSTLMEGCLGLNWKTAHYLIFLCKIIQFISSVLPPVRLPSYPHGII